MWRLKVWSFGSYYLSPSLLNYRSMQSFRRVWEGDGERINYQFDHLFPLVDLSRLKFEIMIVMIILRESQSNHLQADLFVVPTFERSPYCFNHFPPALVLPLCVNSHITPPPSIARDHVEKSPHNARCWKHSHPLRRGGARELPWFTNLNA